MYDPFLSDQTVRLSELKLMKTPKGEKVEVIKSLAADWKSFGVHLDFDGDGTTLNLIEAGHRNHPIACCMEMFQRWLQGSGRQPVTWGVLVELLEDFEHRHLARKIKEAQSLPQ